MKGEDESTRDNENNSSDNTYDPITNAMISLLESILDTGIEKALVQFSLEIRHAAVLLAHITQKINPSCYKRLTSLIDRCNKLLDHHLIEEQIKEHDELKESLVLSLPVDAGNELETLTKMMNFKDLVEATKYSVRLATEIERKREQGYVFYAKSRSKTFKLSIL